MEVLKTHSPATVFSAPKAMPRKMLPSSRARMAGLIGINRARKRRLPGLSSILPPHLTRAEVFPTYAETHGLPRRPFRLARRPGTLAGGAGGPMERLDLAAQE